MTTDVLDMKLSYLLTVAEKIESYIMKKSNTSDVSIIVRNAVKENNDIAAEKMIASDMYSFMIISLDPQSTLRRIVELIKSENSVEYQRHFNPVNIITKLIDREYMLDVGGTRLCYCVKTSVVSNFLLKTFACRRMASVRSYFDFVDPETYVIQKDHLKEIHPSFCYDKSSGEMVGGKKKVKSTYDKKKENIQMIIISRLVEYVRGNSTISNGIIFMDAVQDSQKSAANIFFIEQKFKDAIVDYLKLLIADSYPSYTFKSFIHNDFNIPNDFRLKKYSCLINERTTGQTIYLANLYNSATYEPLPCVKSINNGSYIHICHPIVKLRIIYTDIFMIEQKLGIEQAAKFVKIHFNNIMKAYYDIETFDKTPTWVGYFIDENYAKLKYNMKNKMSNAIETILI